MKTSALLALALIALPADAAAQHPYRHFTEAVEARFARSQPVVSYLLKIDSADLGRYSVEMRIRNARDTLRLAMAVHPESDDRFWRHLEALRVESNGAEVPVVRQDSTLWLVSRSAGETIVRYSIRLPGPEMQRGAWRPFLASTGGLIGGPHSFMYVVGAELAPVHVMLSLPAGWEVATGLVPTSDPRTFFAPTVNALVDSPILAGRFRSWRFALDAVPHRIVYWPAPEAVPFDTVAFVQGIEQLAREAVTLFGRAPYREYTFMFRDGAFGALEHANSVTIGAPSSRLAADPSAFLEQTAHEFLHTWNLMRIRPEGYGGVGYRKQQASSGLWWSEGLTMYYADALLRRAGQRLRDSTRVSHLEGLIARYLAFPGNARLSAEAVSRAQYSDTENLGDYIASTHVQGELIGAMLDLRIRAATGGGRSMDDAMRMMLERYSGPRGFSGRDVERVLAEVCGCAVKPFFDAHIRRGTPIDFDRYLSLVGYRTHIEWRPALLPSGEPAPDLRVRPADGPSGESIRLALFDPETAWGRAGLHSGDELVSINGNPTATRPALQAILGSARIGDTLRVEVRRPAGAYTTTIVLPGYDRPTVRIEEVTAPTATQRAVRAGWLGVPPGAQ